MKVKLLCLIILLTFLSVPTTANAQTATRTSDLKKQISDLKQERQNIVSQTKEQIQAARDQFKERLQTIKDAGKRNLTARLDSNIALVNKKHTDRFSGILTKLQTFLNKISSEVTDAKTLLLAKDAQTKIDLASEAVASQGAKVYTIDITTETNLRTNVGTTISQFRNDLTQTYKLVIDAKQAVQNLRTDKVMMKKEATGSANL